MQELLFSKADVFSVMESQKLRVSELVARMGDGEIEGSSDEEITAHVVEEYGFHVPVLHLDQIYASDDEVRIDVAREDSYGRLFGHGGPVYRNAAVISIHVPFTGDAGLFQVRPSTFSTSMPRGEVADSELLLSYRQIEDRPQLDLKNAYQRDLAEIQICLERLRESGKQLDGAIDREVTQGLAMRRAAFAKRKSAVESLGLPIRRAPPQTASPVPVARAVSARRKTLAMPKASKETDVFISHATEDKTAIARPLADALRARGLRVWYDEYSLTVGDSLRSKIDQGLANCRFGVVILSQAFFAKHWPQQELNGLATRETEGTKVILPVWHHITKQEVMQESPMLADRMAVLSDSGLKNVVDELLRVIAPAIA